MNNILRLLGFESNKDLRAQVKLLERKVELMEDLHQKKINSYKAYNEDTSVRLAELITMRNKLYYQNRGLKHHLDRKTKGANKVIRVLISKQTTSCLF